MKEYNVSDIVKDVRIAIDQNTNDSDLGGFCDMDTLELADVVKGKIVDAAWMIEGAAPVYMCGDGNVPENIEVTLSKVNPSDKYNYAVVAVPSDYLRLVSFRMDDWVSGVYEVITPDDPDYSKQRSRIEGVRGNTERPVLAIVPSMNTEGNNKSGNVFEAYSTKSNVCEYKYVPIPKIENEKIFLCERLYKAIVYATAYLVALAYNADTQAMRLLSTARSLADIDGNEQQRSQYVQQPITTEQAEQ